MQQALERMLMQFCTCLQLQQDRLWTHWVDLAFNKFDANGDGYLSLEEILHHLPPELDGASTQDRILEVWSPESAFQTLQAHASVRSGKS